MQCRPPDRPHVRRPAGIVTDDDRRRQQAKHYWPIKRASNELNQKTSHHGMTAAVN